MVSAQSPDQPEMSSRPIFVATHPRACSTAFERVFMTRRETLSCVHEPFGEAFYYGPERMGVRYEENEQERNDSGCQNTTFKSTFDNLDRQASSEGKRLFIKDIIHYLVPPNGQSASIAPSLQSLERVKRGVGTTNSEMNDTTGKKSLNGVNGDDGKNAGRQSAPYPYDTEAEPGNPTVIPKEMLAKFHFAFLIRDPHSSIPSYWRCTIPPLDKVTGFYDFKPAEAGYDEVRRVFEYLRKIGHIGPGHANDSGSVTKGHTDGRTDGTSNGSTNGATDGYTNEYGNTNGSSDGGTDDSANSSTDGSTDGDNNSISNFPTNGNDNGSMAKANDMHTTQKDVAEICVVDADDLLDDPEGILRTFCKSVHYEYDPNMLNWDNEEDQARAKAAFEKWPGFHDDAIESKDLKPRTHKHTKTEAQWDAEWKEKYGEEAAKVIRETVDKNMEDYLYMKQYAIKA